MTIQLLIQNSQKSPYQVPLRRKYLEILSDVPMHSASQHHIICCAKMYSCKTRAMYTHTCTLPRTCISLKSNSFHNVCTAHTRFSFWYAMVQYIPTQMFNRKLKNVSLFVYVRKVIRIRMTLCMKRRWTTPRPMHELTREEQNHFYFPTGCSRICRKRVFRGMLPVLLCNAVVLNQKYRSLPLMYNACV